MKVSRVLKHLRSDGLRGFAYDVEAVAILRRDRRSTRQATSPTGRSSISDSGEYPEFCRRAATDDDVFARFRRSATYMWILEHVTREQGNAYLEEIRRRPREASRFEALLTEREAGGPRRYRFGELGLVSPTTMRYAKVASDLDELFGPLDGLRIAEIGIGYGGQCRVIESLWTPASYELYDLPEVLALAGRFLDASGVDRATIVAHDGRDPERAEVDLVVSNYAFSELRREIQDGYLENVIATAKRGYLTYNHISPPELRSYTAEEFVAMIPGAHVLPETPLTDPENVVVVWGDNVH